MSNRQSQMGLFGLFLFLFLAFPANGQGIPSEWQVRVKKVVSYGARYPGSMGGIATAPAGKEEINIVFGYRGLKRGEMHASVPLRFLDAAGQPISDPTDMVMSWDKNSKDEHEFTVARLIPTGSKLAAIYANNAPLDLSNAERSSVDIVAEEAAREAARRAPRGSGRISGVLLDTSGAPVVEAGVDLAILPVEEAKGKKDKAKFMFLSYAGRTKSDKDGKFTFEGLGANNYIMSVSDSKGHFVGMPVKSGNKDAVFVVGEQSSFDVVVRMNDKGLQREK